MGTQSLKIERGSVIPLLENMNHILEEHWEESAKNKHLMVLKPDEEGYLALEKANKLITLIAYAGDEIVGYSCNIVSKHLHYADLTVAYNDVIFIRKDYRNTPLGLRLIKMTEQEAKKEGVQLMLWHAKENTSLSAILPRTGCKVQEIIFSKEL
jgi:GNAT superfamily N-acetyltransferase